MVGMSTPRAVLRAAETIHSAILAVPFSDEGLVFADSRSEHERGQDAERRYEGADPDRRESSDVSIFKALRSEPVQGIVFSGKHPACRLPGGPPIWCQARRLRPHWSPNGGYRSSLRCLLKPATKRLVVPRSQ